MTKTMERRWRVGLVMLAVLLPWAIQDGDWWRLKRDMASLEEAAPDPAGFCELRGEGFDDPLVVTEASVRDDSGMPWSSGARASFLTTETSQRRAERAGGTVASMAAFMPGAAGEPPLLLSGSAPMAAPGFGSPRRRGLGRQSGGGPPSMAEAGPSEGPPVEMAPVRLLADTVPGLTFDPLSGEVEPRRPVAVPEPTALAVFAAGLLALWSFGRARPQPQPSFAARSTKSLATQSQGSSAARSMR